MRSGEIVAGYVVERLLGSGGTGTVYLARRQRAGSPLALKLLHTQLPNPELARGFARETEIVAHLRHEHIVRMLDRGVETGTPWIAMEYIDGTDSASLPGPLPAPYAAAVTGQLAHALDYAHGHAVVHRDIKPTNVLLASTAAEQPPNAFLTDFGMARLRSETTHLSHSAAATADLAFHSPEQLRGMKPDERSDQYSLACTTYWLFTGAAPFSGADQTAIMHGHLNSPVPRVSSRLSGVPMDLDEVLSRAMAKHPADRYYSCGDFASALQRAVPASPVRVAARPASVAPAARPSRTPALAGAVSRYWAPVLLAVLLLIAVAATTFILTHDRRPSGGAAAAPGAQPSELTVPKAGECVAGRRIGVVGPVRIIDCSRPDATLAIVRTAILGPADPGLDCGGAQIKIITVPTERNPAAQSCAVAALHEGACYIAMSVRFGFEHDPDCSAAGAARYSHRVAGQTDVNLCRTFPVQDPAAAQAYSRIESLHFADPAGPATYCFRPKDR